MEKRAPRGLVWHLLRNKDAAKAVVEKLRKAGAFGLNLRSEPDGCVTAVASLNGVTDAHMALWFQKVATLDEFIALPKAFRAYRKQQLAGA